MIVLQLVTMVACGILNALGGYHWLFCRRYIMSAVLAVEAVFTEWKNKDKKWWEGFLILPVMGTLCLGYFLKGTNDNLGRCLWVALQAFMIGTPFLVTGHIVWYFYVPWLAGAVVLGALYKNWQQKLGDFILGSYLGGIALLIH